MKNLIISFMSLLLLCSCNAQTDKKADKETDAKQGAIEPQEDYKVNKEYDEYGNLIKYDSTYTYYYSNIDKNAMKNDSVFKKFNQYFDTRNSFMNDDLFDDFFNNDNFIEDDFFSEDFFRGNLQRNQEMMDKMFSRMDSIKNNFLLNKYPLKESTEENNDD